MIWAWWFCPWLVLANSGNTGLAMVGLGKRLWPGEQESTTMRTETRPGEQQAGMTCLSKRLRLSSEGVHGSGSSSGSGHLPLNHRLRRDWAIGKINSRQVQEYAFNAELQGATGLTRMAHAGACGKHPGNIHLALVRLFGRPAGSPDIRWSTIPTKSSPRKPLPFLYPHDFFAQMYHERPRSWQRYLRGLEGATGQFWKGMEKTKFVQLHPVLDPSMYTKTIPIGMHGDAGGFTEHESLIVISWNSLLATGTTRSKRFLFTVLPKKECTKGTLDAIFKVFAWSVNIMLTGQNAMKDWEGNPLPGKSGKLAGGWRACLTSCRGDWAWYCEIFGFPKWNENERMCWMCLASSTIKDLMFTDCSRRAGRRTTNFTHESYLAFLARRNLEPTVLLILVLGFRLECILVDVLHAADLGMTAHIIGNVFWETILNRSWGGPNQETNVACLEKDFESWYKETKCQNKIQGSLTKERIRPDGEFPKFKAKGAATRHLAEYALHLCQKFSTGSTHDKIKLALCENLVRFYKIMADAGQFLDPLECQEFAQVGQNLSKMSSILSAEAHANKERLWKYSPKHHLIEHCTGHQAATFGNPRYHWCYADEDLVGLMVEVAENCHTRTVAEMVLVKWLIVAFDNDQDNKPEV